VGVLQKNYSKLRALLKKETLTQQAMWEIIRLFELPSY
jgi:hypothetical protein